VTDDDFSPVAGCLLVLLWLVLLAAAAHLFGR
jgi:hypothetical protein